jgi:uncharacterized protein YndB with AHSA1/START domain
MLDNHKAVIALPSDREIVLTRLFDAPRHLVFEAWTQPEHVKRWWGCDGSSLSVCEIDLRPGGAWRFVMRMADGSDHPFKGIYREVVPPERLVYCECYDVPSIGSPEWLTAVSFEEQDGKTKVISTVLHQSAEARNGHLQAGMEAGAIQTMERLAEHVASVVRTTVP